MGNGKKRADSVVSVEINRSIRTLTFNVAAGGTFEGGTKVLHLERLHPDNVDYAAYFGLKQSVGDKAAQSKDPATGLPAPRADKFAAICSRVDHLESGSPDWSSRGQGMGGDVGALIAAIVAAGLKQDSPELRASVRALDKSQKAALATIPAVKAKLDEAEVMLAGDINAEELLEGFTTVMVPKVVRISES